jgi:hypothetical protein
VHQFQEPSPGNRVVEQMIDTRTGQPSQGRTHDAATHHHIDGIANYQDRLDRAETIKRHKAAFGPDKE